MMKRIIAALVVCAFFTATTKAADVHKSEAQKAYLKNGTVLCGYVQRQDKSENITFRSEVATVCLSGGNVSITDRTYKISELDKQWVKWAEENDAFTGVGDNRTLVLSDIRFDPYTNTESRDSVEEGENSDFETYFRTRNKTVNKVKVLEKGTNLRYLQLTPDSYTFSWYDVESIKADRRSRTALSGIDRVYLLTNGKEVAGQYAGETYSTISLYTDGGLMETFKFDDVAKYHLKGINPLQDIFKQSDLIDVVRTKDGSEFRGIITERNFTKDNNYLMIQTSPNSSQMLKFSEITEYSKEENKEYDPKFDILLKAGEVKINRMDADSVGVTKKGSILVLDSINKNVKIAREKNASYTKVTLEFFSPQKLSGENLILVKLDKTGSSKRETYSFSSDIFDMQKIAPARTETSVNNITKVEYEVSGEGAFAFYDITHKKAMPFLIK